MLRVSVKPSISGISKSVSTMATRSVTALPSASAALAMAFKRSQASLPDLTIS